MALFGLFSGKKKTSAAAAKERLQILISHERQNRHGPDFKLLLVYFVLLYL